MPDQNIFLHSPLPHFALDEACRVTAWNDSCALFTGLDATQVIGTRLHRACSVSGVTLADVLIETGGNPEKYEGLIIRQVKRNIWETWVEYGDGRVGTRCVASLQRKDGRISGAVEAMFREDSSTVYLREEQAAAVARDRYRLGKLVGKSEAMREVYHRILKAAPSDLTVMITGESGTGKEVVADTIHSLSGRAKGPFVAVNCGAIPGELLESEFFGYKKGAFTGAFSDKPGLLDKADGGTLFLDEVAELPLSMQVKLLRFLDSGKFTPLGSTEQRSADIRIITATNRDVQVMVADGSMREDFYFRLYIIPVELPPLRERKEDIPLLIEEFLATIYEKQGPSLIPGYITDAMMRYSWPGNIRELQNTLHRYLALGVMDIKPVAAEQALVEGATEGNLRDLMLRHEAQVFRKALELAGGNRNRAAELLGVPIRTFYRKISRMADL